MTGGASTNVNGVADDTYKAIGITYLVIGGILAGGRNPAGNEQHVRRGPVGYGGPPAKPDER